MALNVQADDAMAIQCEQCRLDEMEGLDAPCRRMSEASLGWRHVLEMA